MSASLINRLVDAQAALIIALDARNADEIEKTTRVLNNTLSEMKARGGWHDEGDAREQVGYALKQAEAAKMRVNYLSDWTRQRIDRIAELRGIPTNQTYENVGNLAKKTAFH
ncbi:MAG: hypothetical protein AABY88_08575 [Pseudomonadota bacterium]